MASFWAWMWPAQCSNAGLALLQHLVRGPHLRLTRLEGFLGGRAGGTQRWPRVKDSTLRCLELATRLSSCWIPPAGPPSSRSGQNFTCCKQTAHQECCSNRQRNDDARWPGFRPSCLYHISPKRLPRPPNLLEDARRGESPTALRDSQQRHRISPWRTANQAPGSPAQRRQPSASWASSAGSESPRSTA